MDVEEDHYGLRVSPAMDITISNREREYSILVCCSIWKGSNQSSDEVDDQGPTTFLQCWYPWQEEHKGRKHMYVLFGSVREEARWRRRKSGGSLPRVRDR